MARNITPRPTHTGFRHIHEEVLLSENDAFIWDSELYTCGVVSRLYRVDLLLIVMHRNFSEVFNRRNNRRGDKV